MGPNRCAKLRSIVEMTLYRYVLLSNLKDLSFFHVILCIIMHSNVSKHELDNKLLRQVYVRSREPEKILGLSKKSFIFFRFRNWCLKTLQDASFCDVTGNACQNSRVQGHFTLRKSPSRKLIDSLLPLTPWQTQHPRSDRDLVAMIEARKMTV